MFEVPSSQYFLKKTPMFCKNLDPTITHKKKKFVNKFKLTIVSLIQTSDSGLVCLVLA
jgi:hypothetical protein